MNSADGNKNNVHVREKSHSVKKAVSGNESSLEDFKRYARSAPQMSDDYYAKCGDILVKILSKVETTIADLKSYSHVSVRREGKSILATLFFSQELRKKAVSAELRCIVYVTPESISVESMRNASINYRNVVGASPILNYVRELCKSEGLIGIKLGLDLRSLLGIKSVYLSDVFISALEVYFK